MSWLISSAYADNTAYAIRATAEFNGVVYEATSAIPVTNTTNPVQDNNVNWKINSVIRLEDAYSIWSSVYLSLNTDNPKITNSIWLYLQIAEQHIAKVVRSPLQITTRDFVLDDESSFIFPDNLLEIDNIRLKGSIGAINTGSSLQQRGFIEFRNANKANYEVLRQFHLNGIVRDNTLSQFDYPVYWHEEDRCYLAPNYDAGTVVEMTFYGSEAQLGTTQPEVNDDFEPINSASQTLAEWIAAGNSAGNFVQNQAFIDKNLWTDQAPHLVKLGALVAAENDLKDPIRSESWKAEYDRNLEETISEYEAFNARRPHTQQMASAYSR